MSDTLRVLIIEDSEDDARLLLRELRRSGYAPVSERVESESAMRLAFAQHTWDVIVSDYVIPGFGGLEALKIAKESGLEVPFILVSNKVSEETLVEAMRAGAADFIMKDRMKRLGPVVQRELAAAATRHAMERAQIEWRAAFDAVHDAIFIHDAECRIVRANRPYAELSGMAMSSLLGRPYWEVFPKAESPLPGCASVCAGTAEDAEDVFRLAGGETFSSRSFRITEGTAHGRYYLHVIQNITERERAQQVREQSERYYRKLLEGGSEAYYLLDREGKFVQGSDSGERLTGWATTEIRGKGVETFVMPEDLVLARSMLAEIVKNPGQMIREELHLRRADGSPMEAELCGRNFLDDPDIRGIMGTVRDVTERNRQRREIVESEAWFRAIFETIVDGIVVVDPSNQMLESGNAALCRMLGYSPEEIPTLNVSDLHPPEWLPHHVAQFDRVAKGWLTVSVNAPVTRKDGSVFFADISVASTMIGNKRQLVGVFHDVSERKHAEQVLRESETRLKESQRIARLGTWSWENATDTMTWSEEIYRSIGRDPGLPALSFAEMANLFTPESLIRRRAAVEAALASGAPYEIDTELARPGGTIWFSVRGEAVRDADGQIVGLRGTALDITARKKTEQELRRLNWTLRALSQGNSALVHAASEQELFDSCCDAIAGTDGFPLAWIGLARHDPAQSIDMAAASGVAIGFLEGLVKTWGDTPHGGGPTGTAIRSGTTQVISDIASSPAYSPWSEKAQLYGLGSSIHIPIRVDRKVIGGLAVYAGEPNAMSAAHRELFEELANDIGYGVAARRTQAAFEEGLLETERSARSLREVMESALGALVATVEIRDPYTGGHQRRVAEVSSAIGKELGLEADRIEGLRFAASIHDIGKISVPAEILSRPAKLLPMEFALIQFHSQTGFDIVKGVNFPWPVAQIILQHHERMDGSGYPQGLKGEAILLEARIVAVADVVEAMSSHRPYRPGLGIDKALAEIGRGRGTMYDAEVADACLRIFREKGYTIPV